MLSETDKQLLTAAVDGDLAPAQERAVRRLLRNSAEARTFFARLKHDSRRLRRLPAVAPPSDFVAGVMGEIAERGLQPTPPPPEPRPRRAPMAPYAVVLAASVLFVLTLGAFLYFGDHSPTPSDSPFDLADATIVDPPLHDLTPRGGSIFPTEVDVQADDPVLTPEVPNPPGVAVADHVPEQPIPDPGPASPQIDEQRLTSPGQTILNPFEVVPLTRMLILSPLELDREESQTKLLEELNQSKAVRVELFCRDSLEAYRRVSSAYQEMGSSLMIDALAQSLVRDKQPTQFVFYCQTVQPEEFAALLRSLGDSDRAAEQQRLGTGVFDKVILTPFQAIDDEDLARLLGISNRQVEAGRIQLGSSGTRHDPSQPLSEDTAARVANALANRSEGDADSPPREGSPTLVLPFFPNWSGSLPSAQTQRFLQLPPDETPGTIPVLLMLRIVAN